MKKIFVPIKRVPDWQIKVKPTADSLSIETGNLKWIINTFDEIAVEEAIRIKESNKGFSEVVVACIGPAGASEQIRSALAMGADRGVHVVTDSLIDSEQAARILCALYRRESFDLVIMGKQAIDSDSGQAPQRISKELDIPQATFASAVEIEEGASHIKVTREVDGGLETLRLALPAVVSTDLRLNEPRLRSLPGIVAAKKKPLEEVTIESLGNFAESRVKIRKLILPPKRTAGKKVSSVDELVSLLRSEAKVI
ncbi:MAG TPA: electron transfer flavoprotein subunit beta/FixA family protein [Oligoflexia bacterium]|nr:electron transfer flavoprotein subunit beta/FixA family protein [Oligoflexia bacterium]HMP48903.1 electron transfer flavoprotein subunit beta/FixA family protein [Oligoflexia bacterium]